MTSSPSGTLKSCIHCTVSVLQSPTRKMWWRCPLLKSLMLQSDKPKTCCWHWEIRRMPLYLPSTGGSAYLTIFWVMEIDINAQSIISVSSSLCKSAVITHFPHYYFLSKTLYSLYFGAVSSQRSSTVHTDVYMNAAEYNLYSDSINCTARRWIKYSLRSSLI